MSPGKDRGDGRGAVEGGGGTYTLSLWLSTLSVLNGAPKPGPGPLWSPPSFAPVETEAWELQRRETPPPPASLGPRHKVDGADGHCWAPTAGPPRPGQLGPRPKDPLRLPRPHLLPGLGPRVPETPPGPRSGGPGAWHVALGCPRPPCVLGPGSAPHADGRWLSAVPSHWSRLRPSQAGGARLPVTT